MDEIQRTGLIATRETTNVTRNDNYFNQQCDWT